MRIELRDSLEFLYSDSQVGKSPRRSCSVDVAKGGTASVHVLMNDVPLGEEVHWVTSWEHGRSNSSCYRLIDVPVEVNTGPVGFIEKEGESNPHVARRAPFRVFDAMKPVGPRFKADASTLALRIHLPVGHADRIPSRVGLLKVSVGKDFREFQITLNVHPPSIPSDPAKTLPYTNWFSVEAMAERHGLRPWSEAHWAMIRRYADLMHHARQNAFWVPLGSVFSMEDGRPALNRARLRRYVQTFTDAGLHFIEGGHVAHRTGGRWEAETFDVSMTTVRATSPEGNVLLWEIGRQLTAEIVRHGWAPRWIQHVTDEPVKENAIDYRILTGLTRKHIPGVPILDATMDLSLAGSVDIWCPQAQEYQRHREAFDAQRVMGDRVWFYTCCFPGGPWLNRLMDMELLRPALFGWAAALFKLDGFLHWGYNHYKAFQNPFEQNVVDHGGGNCLPAGDTHIVYPGEDGPLSSVRLEAQREGFEDYELLRALERKDPELAKSILRRVIRGFDDYTKDVSVFRRARRSLLEAFGRHA